MCIRDRYIGYIISFDDFFLVQGEKGKRSNIDEDTGKRKAARYSSQNVLSGILVCAECGANYRRITRPSGEVVWRCASRVEHGKRVCRHSSSIAETFLKKELCRLLYMTCLLYTSRFQSRLIRYLHVLSSLYRFLFSTPKREDSPISCTIRKHLM